MWQRSNIPAAVRQCFVSSTPPTYWTGISQPEKSTMVAPAAGWTS